MHGYQLKKHLSDTLGPFWQVSYGSLYPALKRLKSGGAVEMVFPKGEMGRRKNVYRVTDDGERLFSKLVEESGREKNDENGFRVRLAFFRYLKPEARLGVLERRRAFLIERLADFKRRVTAYREPVDTYTLSLMRHGKDSTEHDIAWLDGMIETEQRATRKPRRPSKGTRTRSSTKSETGVQGGSSPAAGTAAGQAAAVPLVEAGRRRRPAEKSKRSAT